MKTIVGLFDTRDQAESAVQDLERAGYGRDRVSVVAGKVTGIEKDMVEAPATYVGATGIWKYRVAAVKIDHQTTIRISTRRGPMRSPSHPPGTSKSAYAQAKTPSTQPH